MLTFFFLLIGLVIGSFLNVAILRLEKNSSLGGRSLCPMCQSLIHWYDNIPVISFLVLRGKCRQCRVKIAWQYPLVELGTGLLFALFGTLSFGVGGPSTLVFTVWLLFLIALLIAIAVYDVRTMEIPFIWLILGVGGAIVYALVGTFVSGTGFFVADALWQDMLLGGGVAALLFYALVFFSRETWMGMGDVWLAGIGGAAVGFSALVLFLTLSFFIGALVGVVLLLLGRKSMQSRIPFAPFLALGTVLTLLLLLMKPWWLSLLLLPSV